MTKTSIRYAKENDREKRERERKVEGVIYIMLSPNYVSGSQADSY